MNSRLPFYEIFQAFRNQGHPLGISEYEDLLELIVGGGNYEASDKIISKADLLYFCKLLWLKPDQVPYVFENIFNENYKKLFGTQIIKPADEPNENRRDNANLSKPAELNKNEVDEQPIEDEEIIDDDPGITSAIESRNVNNFFRIVIGESSENKASFKKGESRDIERKFLFSDNNFPVSERGIFQIFSSLPEKTARRTSYEVDVPATVAAIAKNGFFREIVFQRKSEIINQLLILQDNGGSMIAFEKLSSLISGTLGDLFKSTVTTDAHTNNYYFHNVISEYLYVNHAGTKYKKTLDIINELKGRRIALLIISDAGAARGSNSDIRVQDSIRMLMKLQKMTSKIVWLNPLPEHRWQNTAAARIAKFIPMFEISYNKLPAAVEFLKGKQYKTA